jgi:hypothetical protein
MLLPAGSPIHSARIASTATVNGLPSANWRRPSGSDSIGTKAEEMKVRGKITMNPIACADSAEDATSAKSAKIHEKA